MLEAASLRADTIQDLTQQLPTETSFIWMAHVRAHTQTHTHTYTCAHKHTMHAHKHTHTNKHTHTHAHTCAHTHTHTHTNTQTHTQNTVESPYKILEGKMNLNVTLTESNTVTTWSASDKCHTAYNV
jgi:hypothetical protein